MAKPGIYPITITKYCKHCDRNDQVTVNSHHEKIANYYCCDPCKAAYTSKIQAQRAINLSAKYRALPAPVWEKRGKYGPRKAESSEQLQERMEMETRRRIADARNSLKERDAEYLRLRRRSLGLPELRIGG